MDNLLGTLILVIPGVIAYYVTRMFGYANNKQITDYEKTAIGLIYNIPGILLFWLIESYFLGANHDFKSLQNSILSMPNFFIYMTEALVCAFYTAHLWESKGKNLLWEWVAKKRKSLKRPQESLETPWEAFFGPDEEAIMGIYPIGQRNQMVLGVVSHTFKPGDQEKGILLCGTEQLVPWFAWFGPPLRTYVDVISKTVYEYYPASALDDAESRVKAANPTWTP